MRGLGLLLVLGACTDEAVPIPPECNGSVELCERRFDQVAYPATHNAMSNEADGWVYPNQYFGIQRQLEDGVRAMMIDTYDYQGAPALCHVFCQAGKLAMIDGLRTIRTFLDKNRGEVVSLLIEAHLGAAETAAVFAASELIKYVHVHPAGDPWPTLRELIDADERLIVFTESGGGDPAWYMDLWAHSWETHYHFEAIDEMSCAKNRGGAGNPLFTLNHFLTRAYAVPAEAPVVNAAVLVDRAQRCRQESGRLPNFVTVDFYSVGSLFETTRMLNGL